MAGPQLGDGFTRVANEILDEICQYKFNGAQLRIIIKVWRLTYGYGRKDHEFSNSFLQMTTGLSESSIKREIAVLIKSKVLRVTKKATSTEARKVAFNKYYDQWNIPKSGDPVGEENDLFGVPDMSPQEDFEVSDSIPLEVSDMNPQDVVLGYQIRPPYKERRSLKKSIKEKEQMFDEFYSLYPRKIARKKAESSWRTLCKDKSFDPDQAIAYTANFAETSKLINTEIKFLPYPATFLNQKRYDDYPTVDPEGLAKPTNSNQKSSKVNDNMDFFLQGLEGDRHDKGRVEVNSSESFPSLPEPSS